MSKLPKEKSQDLNSLSRAKRQRAVAPRKAADRKAKPHNLGAASTDAATPKAHDDFLAQKAEAIRALKRNVVRDIIEVGRHLSEVQSELARRGGAHDGRWLEWLRQEFPNWSQRSAYRFIEVYKLAQTPQFATLTNWDALDLSGVYQIASSSTAESARTEIAERAEAGERLPHGEVKEIIATHVEADKSATKRIDKPPLGMVKITAEDLSQIATAVEAPDHSFHLGDVEKAVIAKFGVSAETARSIVRKWDRGQTGSGRQYVDATVRTDGRELNAESAEEQVRKIAEQRAEMWLAEERQHKNLSVVSTHHEYDRLFDNCIVDVRNVILEALDEIEATDHPRFLADLQGKIATTIDGIKQSIAGKSAPQPAEPEPPPAAPDPELPLAPAPPPREVARG
jgi:hypothetical protein